jgi:hypothetical protein
MTADTGQITVLVEERDAKRAREIVAAAWRGRRA